jgi:hypothetical protein
MLLRAPSGESECGKSHGKFQNATTLKLIDTGPKNFIFIIYPSDCTGLQNFIEIQGCHVNCCVDLTWNNLIC